MLTRRTLSLTTLGLLTGFVAAAQSTPSAEDPTPTNVLSWVVWAVAGVVLLMAIITAGSVTSAAQRRLDTQPEPKAHAAAKAPARPAATTAKVSVQPAMQEEVYA